MTYQNLNPSHLLACSLKGVAPVNNGGNASETLCLTIPGAKWDLALSPPCVLQISGTYTTLLKKSFVPSGSNSLIKAELYNFDNYNPALKFLKSLDPNNCSYKIDMVTQVTTTTQNLDDHYVWEGIYTKEVTDSYPPVASGGLTLGFSMVNYISTDQIQALCGNANYPYPVRDSGGKILGGAFPSQMKLYLNTNSRLPEVHPQEAISSAGNSQFHLCKNDDFVNRVTYEIQGVCR